MKEWAGRAGEFPQYIAGDYTAAVLNIGLEIATFAVGVERELYEPETADDHGFAGGQLCAASGAFGHQGGGDIAESLGAGCQTGAGEILDFSEADELAKIVGVEIGPVELAQQCLASEFFFGTHVFNRRIGYEIPFRSAGRIQFVLTGVCDPGWHVYRLPPQHRPVCWHRCRLQARA